MLITPLPGASREHLANTLTSLQDTLRHVQAAGPISAITRAYKYLDWTHEARRMLRRQIHPDDLEHLVPSRSYEVVLTAAAGLRDFALGARGDLHDEQGFAYNVSMAGERQLNGLLGALVDQHLESLQAAATDLTQAMQRFQRDAEVVVLDTNIYMEHPQQLEDLDLAELLHLSFEPIHILVPLVVVDELDKGKRSGWNGWKAAYSVAYVDRVTQRGGVVREKDFTDEDRPRGEVTIEVVFDPPGHIRLPINDDEIISRALAIKTLAGKQLRILTYDTGMAMRGRAAGLQVHWLEQPKKDNKIRSRRQRGSDAPDRDRSAVSLTGPIQGDPPRSSGAASLRASGGDAYGEAS
ncbi:PIN domain-containing protein [Micromonospora sp. NPDC047793]|uniref:PIN domain-containing protein n=1 Tax=Micromonospora sp. NPDC047793 TaxID=3154342 RepID=UPI0033D95F61